MNTNYISYICDTRALNGTLRLYCMSVPYQISVICTYIVFLSCDGDKQVLLNEMGIPTVINKFFKKPLTNFIKVYRVSSIMILQNQVSCLTQYMFIDRVYQSIVIL